MTAGRRAIALGALGVGALLVLGGLGFVRCMRVETPRIAGRVVDRATGEPVSGADVMLMRSVERRGGFSPSQLYFDYRWTTTGEDGSFSFRPSTAKKPDGAWLWHVDEKPSILIIHPRYGSPATFLPDDRSEWTSFDLAIEPSQRTLEALGNPSWSSAICGGLGGEGYVHCCEAAYGSLQRCDPSAPDLQ